MPEVTFKDEMLLVLTDALDDWTVSDEDDEQPLEASGSCPCCGHKTTANLVYESLTKGSSGREPRPSERLTTMMACQCSHPHGDPEHPEHTYLSCGRKWPATITLNPELRPRVRPVTDARLIPAALGWQDFVAAQESRFQSQAEKWAAAVTTLLGLFGLAAFVTSKEAFSGLPTEARVVATITVISGLIAGVAAVYLSNRAAYGWPEFVQLENDADLIDWFADYKNPRIRVTANKMKWAVRLAITSLGLLLAASAIMWVVPRVPVKGDAAHLDNRRISITVEKVLTAPRRTIVPHLRNISPMS